MKLARALEQQKAPNLALYDQILNEDGCQQLADFLSQNPQYVNIEIRGCNINARGFEKICRSLSLETRTLLAEWNAIGAGVAALCDVLLNPACQIQLIDLKNNRIQAESCARIAQVLKQNQTLQSLNLRWNEIGEKGAHFLWEGLQYNRTLKFLDISCNKIPEGIASQIKDKVEANRGADMMTKNQQNIKEAARVTANQELVHTQPRQQPPQKKLGATAQKKNDSLRTQQLKEQIDQELRANRVVTEELTNRMNAIRKDILAKEQAVAMARRRHEELLSQKAVIEAEYNAIRMRFDDLAEASDSRQSQVMDDYVMKNKHVLALENEYMRELQALRHDNKAQIDGLNQQWQPRLDGIQHKYNTLLKANDRFNQELLHMKELFLKMRLDHDENVKSIEARILIEEKAKYQHQSDLLRRRHNEVEQDLKNVQMKGNQLQDDWWRLEQNHQRERDQIEQQIQQEREQIHQNHLVISKKIIKAEKLINNNIVADGHIEKLVRKVEELYFMLNHLRDTFMDDLQKRRNLHEQEYLNYKHQQQLTHQRTMDLELMIRNQGADNVKLKAEYEKLCHITQGRIASTISEVCRLNVQLN